MTSALLAHSYALILAGGEGTRFAPYSTPESPKQFLPIIDLHKTMIQETYARIKELIPSNQIFVSTNLRYVPLVMSQLPEISPHQIIGEPLKKNTAPPMALISALLASQDPEAVILFLPSDHYIHDAAKAIDIFIQGMEIAGREPVMVTFGVTPTFPSPDYGYIKYNAHQSLRGAYAVEKFVEKPDLSKAEHYVASGNYFWNSGIFAWRPTILLKAIEACLPRMALLLRQFNFTGPQLNNDDMNRFFKEVESISIDYGVMEKAMNVRVCPFSCGWSDVGTWKGLSELRNRFSIQLSQEILGYLQTATTE